MGNSVYLRRLLKGVAFSLSANHVSYFSVVRLGVILPAVGPYSRALSEKWNISFVVSENICYSVGRVNFRRGEVSPDLRIVFTRN